MNLSVNTLPDHGVTVVSTDVYARDYTSRLTVTLALYKGVGRYLLDIDLEEHPFLPPTSEGIQALEEYRSRLLAAYPRHCGLAWLERFLQDDPPINVQTVLNTTPIATLPDLSPSAALAVCAVEAGLIGYKKVE